MPWIAWEPWLVCYEYKISINNLNCSLRRCQARLSARSKMFNGACFSTGVVSSSSSTLFNGVDTPNDAINLRGNASLPRISLRR